MSNQDNVQTVKAVYDAFGRGDIPTVIDALTDDVDWASEAASTDVPWWGKRQGKAEVGTFFEQLGTNMEVTEFTPLVLVGDGDDVLAVIRYGATSRSNGKSTTMQLHHHWTFRDGKIASYRGSEDTLETLRVFQD